MRAIRLAGLLAVIWAVLLSASASGQGDPLTGSPSLGNIQGHVILGPTFVAFETVPPMGGFVGLGGMAYQNDLLFDVQILYAYGATDNAENFTGLAATFGMGYSVVETFRSRLYLVGGAGYAALGSSSGDERSTGAVLSAGLGYNFTLSATPGTRWSVIGVRLAYQQYFQDTRSGAFLSITFGQAIGNERGRGCNCSGM